MAMLKRALKSQKLIALFFLGVILYNAPFLSLFNSPSRIMGIPVLFVYLFTTWAVLVFLIGWIIEYRRTKPLGGASKE